MHSVHMHSVSWLMSKIQCEELFTSRASPSFCFLTLFSRLVRFYVPHSECVAISYSEICMYLIQCKTRICNDLFKRCLMAPNNILH